MKDEYTYKESVEAQAQCWNKINSMSEEDCNAVDEKGNTILHRTAMVSDIQSMMAIVQKGANFSIRNAEGKKAIDILNDFVTSSSEGINYDFLLYQQKVFLESFESYLCKTIGSNKYDILPLQDDVDDVQYFVTNLVKSKKTFMLIKLLQRSQCSYSYSTVCAKAIVNFWINSIDVQDRKLLLSVLLDDQVKGFFRNPFCLFLERLLETNQGHELYCIFRDEDYGVYLRDDINDVICPKHVSFCNSVIDSLTSCAAGVSILMYLITDMKKKDVLEYETVLLSFPKIIHSKPNVSDEHIALLKGILLDRIKGHDLINTKEAVKDLKSMILAGVYDYECVKKLLCYCSNESCNVECVDSFARATEPLIDFLQDYELWLATDGDDAILKQHLAEIRPIQNNIQKILNRGLVEFSLRVVAGDKLSNDEQDKSCAKMAKLDASKEPSSNRKREGVDLDGSEELCAKRAKLAVAEEPTQVSPTAGVSK